MRLFLSLAAHFKHCQGRLYSMELSYDLYKSRYLGDFDEVLIVARSAPVSLPPEGWHEVTGPGVKFVPLPDYLGPWQFFRVRGQIKRRIEEAIVQCDCFTLRVPCDIGTLAWHSLRQRGLPYNVEVVGDPWLALSPGSNKSVVRPLARRLSRQALRRQCRHASAALYLTNHYLQSQYPPGPKTLSVACSEAYLPPSMYVDNLIAREKRLDTLSSRLAGGNDPVRLGFIGTFNVLYKAPDVAIKAMARLKAKGLNIELHMVGGGSLLESMQELAIKEGVEHQVIFLGRLPAGMAIAEYLDTVDLFLNASRQEGLPRALLEAMARGCPAVGSFAGGIAELLPEEFLAPIGDAVGLADLIDRMLQSPMQLKSVASRNLELSRQFADELLKERRHNFHLALRDKMAAAKSAGRPELITS